MIEENEFYWQLLDSLQDGVYFADKKRRITYWNKAAESITGYCSSEVLGKCCGDNLLIHIDEHGTNLCKANCPLAKCMETGERNEAVIFFHHKKGHRVPVRVRVNPVKGQNNDIAGAVEMFTDLSSKKLFQEKIERLDAPKLLDPVTQLPNRNYLDLKLKAKFAVLNEYDRTFGFLFIRIDDLENVEVKEGKNAARELLKLVARTLLNNISPHDTVAHWSDSDFAMILSSRDPETVKNKADTIRILLENSDLNLAGKIVEFTASIGVFQVETDDVQETVTKNVDTLINELKEVTNGVYILQ